MARNNNKDEDNSLKTLNDKNQQASSQKFRQLKNGSTFICLTAAPQIPFYSRHKKNLFITRFQFITTRINLCLQLDVYLLGSSWCHTPLYRYAYPNIDTYASAPMYAHSYQLIYPFMDIYIYIYIYSFILMNTHTHTHTHTHLTIYVGVHSVTYICIDTLRPLHGHIYIYGQLTAICIYTHTSNPMY